MKVIKLSEIHLKERVSWLNHPNVYKHMNMKYPITFEETDRWYTRISINPERIDLAFQEEENIVSMTGLTNLDLVNGLFEFYIIVNPNRQGEGYGIKTTAFTINYAFATYNIHKIYLYTNHFNERANKLYNRLGFKLEGTLRKHKYKDGQFIDRCIYGLLKKEWEETNYFNSNVKLDH